MHACISGCALQVAVLGNTLQLTATHRNTLQHTATDHLLQVNGVDMTGKSIPEASQFLRGAAGATYEKRHKT